jgi:YtcA family
MRRSSRTTVLLLPAIFLPCGCAYSPSVDVLGSYFPAWMACIIIGLFITLIIRLLLIGLGIQPYIRPKSLVYPGMLIFFTMTVWLIFFKN